MFGKGIKIFNLFGFEVKIDLSWPVIAVLITWSLATGYFPRYYAGLTARVYWWMGIAGAIGLFCSVVFHEFFHSFVARRFGLPMKGITLFIFGGVAEMTDEPENPKVEFLMAAAGPASSIVLGFIFFSLFAGLVALRRPWPFLGVFGYLAFINWTLAAFNLVPAFPLDGGRMLRAALWKWKNNLPWATRWASSVGKTFGMLLIIFGVANIVLRNFIGGIWFFLIGIFLRSAAESSYSEILMRKALEGVSVRQLMERDVVTVSPDITLQELVERYIYKYHFKLFPVVHDGKLLGCITAREATQVPRSEWDRKKVFEILKQCSRENTIGPEHDAVEALRSMNIRGENRLMVVENGDLAGIVSNRDLMQYISRKMDVVRKDADTTA